MDYIDRNESFHNHPKVEETIDGCLKQLEGAGYTSQHGIPTYIRDTLLPAFEKLFYGKCAYCEQKIKERYAVLDYWRPESNARGKGGVILGGCYQWLKTDSENLYFACSRCVTQRNGRFQTRNQNSTDSTMDIATLNREEHPLLIDPCRPHPAKHITSSQTQAGLELVGLTEEGNYTIHVFDLNRPSLVHRRTQCVKAVLALLTQHIEERRTPEELKEYLTPSREFRGILLQEVLRYLTERKRELPEEWQRWLSQLQASLPNVLPSQKVYATPTQNIKKTQDLTTNALLRAIKIENFRGIEYLHLSCLADATTSKEVFGEERCKAMNIPDLSLAPCVHLIGNNKAGKTGVLQAIAMTLMGAQDRAYYHPLIQEDISDYITHGAEECRVSISFSGVPDCSMALSRKSGTPAITNPLPLFILGYGCSRNVQRSRGKRDPNTSDLHIKNLFGYTDPMEHCFTWLEHLEENDYHQAVAVIKSVLPDQGCLFEEKAGRNGAKREVFVQPSQAHSVKLHCLSEGYRSLIGLVCDILAKYAPHSSRVTPAERIEGILLLDEIANHLDTRWASEVAIRLRIAFPRLCLVLSSHNYQTLRGLGPDEIFHLWRFGNKTLVEGWSQSIVQSEDSEINSYFKHIAQRESRTSEEIRLYLERRRHDLQMLERSATYS